ncbi:tRNA synthetases class I (M)-domain-containing protein [Xylariales sp. PMI_506]|nr:tRNA synthetases class I (M)-domain-containing protein [Xylariales sp. PMI_506]
MPGFAATSTRRLLRIPSRVPFRGHWVCSPCAHVQGAQSPQSFAQSSLRSFSASTRRNDAADKPYYVTTPIFYVNSAPHVGHLYTMVLSDVFKRWQVLKGDRAAYLLTGTDEHGMKIQQAADFQHIPPKVLCDNNAEIFKDLAHKANISNDHFIRTTDPDHREAVEYFWMRLKESGYIYESKHEGWYCVSDETFYPESMVTKEISPSTGKAYMACIETGNVVEWTEERNYHFRMTALKDKLLEFYKQNPTWVVPASRMAEVINWVEHNLEDLSISRPRNRLEWGIPVPDDPTQTIYVWVDALINYITYAGYPNWNPGSGHQGVWPADLQIIGKDIVRFHCVYWPALLMALDLPLPKRILSHAHWLMDSRKMSKSIGNVVNPFFAMERWGVDTMRYFLVLNGGIEQDSNYNNAIIVEAYKKGLQGGLGNLLNRVIQSKKWSAREIIQDAHERGLENLMQSSQGEHAVSSVRTEVQMQSIEMLANSVSASLDEGYPGKALKKIMAFIYDTNSYLSEKEPWRLQGKGPAEAEELRQVVYVAAESLRITGILLQPFMPEKATGLLDRLGVDVNRRSLSYANIHADSTYGAPMVPLGAGGAQGSLFPPIPWEG